MNVEPLAISCVLVLTPSRFGDARGFFSETWNQRRFADLGIEGPFVQDNHAMSAQAGVVRGLHLQIGPNAQGKLVRCGRGALYDVAVDGRRGSATYGQWVGVELSFENGRQLWVPPGFLHGFVTRMDDTEVVYKCTGFYDKAADGAVRWDSLGIDWGVSDPLLSDKDRAAVPFAEWQSPFEA